VNTNWRDLGYTVGDGWKLIFYPEGGPAGSRVHQRVLGPGLDDLRGLLGGRTHGDKGRRRTPRAAKTAVALVLLAMIIVPMTTHLKGSSLLEWIGALVGIELGLVLGSRTWPDLIKAPQTP
jgi:hypothetical protein